MAVKDVTVRTQSLDGTWDTLGTGSARGVWPENVVLEADPVGPSKATFSLRRDPTAFWPDIGAFTPVEVEVAGTLVWSGRISDTPSQVSSRQMNVECQGWQYHLDDDVFKTFYVHTALPDWKDMRSLPAANLAVSVVAGQPTAGDGVVALGFPADTAVPAGARSGVTLDLAELGAAGDFTTIAIDWESSNNAAGITCYCTTTNSDDPGTGGNDLLSFNLGSGASGTTGGSTSSPKRRLFIYLYWSAGGTLSADVWLRIKGIRLFRTGTYVGGGAAVPSVLRASHVVNDALDRGTVLLSEDRSGIQSTSSDLPSYAPDWQTPRAAITAVNAFHDWQFLVDVDRRPVYRPKPSQPLFEIGAWSAVGGDDDASMNSGEEIYNGAAVTAQAPDGSPVVASRSSASSGELYIVPGTPQTITNYPASYGTPAGDGLVAFNSFPSNAVFYPGMQYVAVMAIKAGVAGTTASVAFGGPPLSGIVTDVPLSTTDFTPITVPWTPTVRMAGSDVTVSFAFHRPASETIVVQSVKIYRTGPTMVDRRGFKRRIQLPVESSLPTDGNAAALIGDTWLSGHKTTPFKGSATLIGDDSVRNILTGHSVPLEQLLLNTGQLLRFSDRIDPDTGGHGRDGRIAAVTYTPASDTAQVTVDNSRASFEALMARLAAVQRG